MTYVEVYPHTILSEYELELMCKRARAIHARGSGHLFDAEEVDRLMFWIVAVIREYPCADEWRVRDGKS